jgi:hypothetical protein
MIDGEGAPVKASRCTNQVPMASCGNIRITGFYFASRFSRETEVGRMNLPGRLLQMAQAPEKPD